MIFVQTMLLNYIITQNTLPTREVRCKGFVAAVDLNKGL